MDQRYQVAPLPKFIKVVGWSAGVLLVAMTVVGGAGSAGAAKSPVPAAPAAGNVYSTDLLRRAAKMTQGMSTPNASGPMFSGHSVDEQLRLAGQDPEFVRELNKYEQDLNRSLGRAASGGTGG